MSLSFVGEAFMQMFDDDAPAPKRFASSVPEAAPPADDVKVGDGQVKPVV